MNRRSFFGALILLPFIGKLVHCRQARNKIKICQIVANGKWSNPEVWEIGEDEVYVPLIKQRLTNPNEIMLSEM